MFRHLNRPGPANLELQAIRDVSLVGSKEMEESAPRRGIGIELARRSDSGTGVADEIIRNPIGSYGLSCSGKRLQKNDGKIGISLFWLGHLNNSELLYKLPEGNALIMILWLSIVFMNPYCPHYPLIWSSWGCLRFLHGRDWWSSPIWVYHGMQSNCWL